MFQNYPYSLFFLLLIFSACSKEIQPIETISLNGDWQFKQVGKEGWIKAKVPGVVQLDLLRAGLIKDPFYGRNEKEIGWIELENWEYQRTFELSASLLEQEVIDLVFDGLDTYADVYINGQSILQADNMFCTWRVNCKPYLKVGENSIQVRFKSPIKEKEAAYHQLGYQLPAGNDAGAIKVSPFVRKAPYHFGWDWGPRMVTMGIWRPVRIEAYRFAKVHDVYFEQVNISPKQAHINTQIEIEYLETAEETLELLIKQEGKLLKKAPIKVTPGTKTYQLDFTLQKPKLWWSNGLGEPHLNQFTVELKRGTQILHTETQKIGLRKIELIQEADSIGTSYYFRLNGQAVFMKGANYIPQDNLLPRVTHKQYDNLIQNAVDANMNMLRVWGGGIYEEDYFYDRCDEKGILVWQDFMFACGMYPSDTSFLKNVQKEIQQNVRRLRNHACIALWCGNNEMEVAWNNWGWQKQFGYSPIDSTTIITGYQTIFKQLIPETLKKLSPHRPYVSSSPLSNWGKAENFNHKSMHYWGVWHGREPFENYPTNVGRFMSEYGFQSFPTMKTIEAFADSSQWNLDSEVMQHHQKSYIGNGMIQKHLESYYPKATSFENFVYLSQLTQAYGLTLAIESHRQSKGHCMGSLYWQINDCWPGPSWSSVDYFGRWKALHYNIRSLYQEVLLSAKKLDKNRLQLDLVSDRKDPVVGNLQLEVLNFDGKVINTRQENKVKLVPGQAGLSFEYNISTLLKQQPNNTVVLRLNFKGSDFNYQRLYYLEIPKKLHLKKHTLNSQLIATQDGYQLTLKANTLVKNLLVSVNAAGNWSDNYFDLMPNEEKTIELKTTDKFQAKDIQYLSINDLLN